MYFYVIGFSAGTGAEMLINIVAAIALYTKVYAFCKRLFRRDCPQGIYHVVSGLPWAATAVDLRERRYVRNLLLHVARPARHTLVLPRQEHDPDIQVGPVTLQFRMLFS